MSGFSGCGWDRASLSGLSDRAWVGTALVEFGLGLGAGPALELESDLELGHVSELDLLLGLGLVAGPGPWLEIELDLG